MRREAIPLFACPQCGGSLRIDKATSEDATTGEIAEGNLSCSGCRGIVPIIRYIPRFVPSESYAASFGFQWNRFDRIQIDKFMENDLSRDRFIATTGWPSRLEGQRILEAGCGAGRFTQFALESGAEVYSFDLSNAVEANYRNNGRAPNLHLFQASIYGIPLARGSFDKIFCFGVLQHCPNVKEAFLGLIPYLRLGGEIVIDVYEKEAGIPPLKYWVRPFLVRMKTETVYKLLRWTIPPAFELKKALHRVPTIGPTMGKLIPIGPISHAPRLNYTDEQLKEIKILSALDMLSPKYDQPQRIEDVQAWFEEARLTEVGIWYGYNGINARGRRAQ
jgi:SAM-dependent methyltransferase